MTAWAAVAALYMGWLGTFSDSVSIGSIIVGVLVALATLVGLVYGVRYKVAYEASKALADSRKEQLEDEKARHEQASKERREALAQISDMRANMERLEALPNLTILIDKMSETAEHQDKHALERLKVGMDSMTRLFETIIERHNMEAERRHREMMEDLRRLTGGSR